MFLSHHRLRRPMLRLVDHVGLARMYIGCLVCLACFVGASDRLRCSWAKGRMAKCTWTGGKETVK